MEPLSNTLVIEASRLCFQPILYAGLQLIVPKCCPPTTVSYEERDGNHREASPGWLWWVTKHHWKRFRSLFLAAAVCGRALSWRRTIPENNIPRRLFWIKESNYSTCSTFGGRLYCLGMFTGSLRAQKWQVLCVAIDGHTRDIVQHICAKLHLILTVVLILRLIGPWKKNSPRSYTNLGNYFQRVPCPPIWKNVHSGTNCFVCVSSTFLYLSYNTKIFENCIKITFADGPCPMACHESR